MAVALDVLREIALAEDAVQEAYLRAFRRLRDLEDAAAFPGWLRCVVITVPNVPLLDEGERRWSDAQRHRLAAALLRLNAEERRICDRRYHGGWSLDRLAKTAGIPEPTMRKRLKRIRNNRYGCRPIRVWSSGKTYRACQADATHLEAFHTLPARAVQIMSVHYPMCSRAWEVAVDDHGEWVEVTRHIAVGAGYGLERFAMLRYGIDDIRKIDVARVA